MSAASLPRDSDTAVLLADPHPDDHGALALQALLATRPTRSELMPAVVVGELLGVGEAGSSAFVSYAGQPGHAALVARTIAALQGTDVGRAVVLMFDAGDPHRPIVLGVLREAGSNSLEALPGQVELSVDGTRMTISAKDRLELRCGSASLTLTKAGQIVIDGRTVVSRASEVNRIVGGSVQIN